jgi:hypothetical protein
VGLELLEQHRCVAALGRYNRLANIPALARIAPPSMVTSQECHVHRRIGNKTSHMSGGSDTYAIGAAIGVGC